VVLTFAHKALATEGITVNWYHGKEFLQPVAQAFTIETGIPVVITNGDDSFDTDVILVPDFSKIDEAADAGKFINIGSKERDARVPAQWRDDDGRWYCLVVRLRSIVYAPSRIDADDVASIYDLMDSDLKGKVCLLEGSYKSSRSLLAYLIAVDGEKKARKWAKAVRKNGTTEKDYDNDMDNVARVAKGECDVALLENYYLHYMLEGKRTSKYNIPEEYTEKLADYAMQVKVSWLDQDLRGNPANVTAVAVSSDSKKPEQAKQFIDFLLTDKGQELMAENTFKYPVVPGVEWPSRLKDQGRVRISDFDMNKLGEFYDKADEIYREAGWK
jgi:iron(III) transport system substrate-binding protein